MSILGKKWHIKNENKDKTALQKIFENRGIETESEKNQFCAPSLFESLHDPLLFSDMDKALERINHAIKNQEKIMIFGDYDVDGISGTALLMRAFHELGAVVSYRLPHRVNDGYGLSYDFIDEFISIDVKLLITVDCGISCTQQISYAAKKGIDVIVTDHHSLSAEYPKHAYAVIHPKIPGASYPFNELTGSGVAFKLAHGLYRHHADFETKLTRLLDLASLGTVADCGPLIGENRVIVKYGLQQIKKTVWPGLEALKKIAGITDEQCNDTDCISFHLAPRLNAAGRIDSPYFSLQLLLLSNMSKAQKFAEKLESINKIRRQMTVKALSQAEEFFANEKGNMPLLIGYHQKWHSGIVGLIAAKLTDKYGKPAIIMEDRGDNLVGSIRSRNNFDAVSALQFNRDLLKTYGGHTQAAGFELAKSNLPPFIEGMLQYAYNCGTHSESHQTLDIDCEITPHEISYDLFEGIKQLAPFGIKNEKPQLLLKDAVLLRMRTVGAQNQHLKLEICKEGKSWDVIGFSLALYQDKIAKRLDIAFKLHENTWRDRKRLEFEMIDFKPFRNC